MKPMWDKLRDKNTNEESNTKSYSSSSEQNNTKSIKSTVEQQNNKTMDTPVEVYDDLLNLTMRDNVVKEGKGFEIYSDNVIKYKYLNNLNILLERLRLISAQESAGHNNFHNEKMAID